MDTSAGTDSPALRPTGTGILGSFLRGRRHSNSHLNPPLSPQAESPNPFAAFTSSPAPQPPPMNHSSSASGAFSGILRRRRSAGNVAQQQQAAPASPQPPPPPVPSVPPSAPVAVPSRPGTAPGASPAPGGGGGAPAHRIRLVPHLESRRSLRFDAISRDVREGEAALRIGRFTDRSGSAANAPNALTSTKLAFKSKVVSRTHAEVWAEPGGRFFIKDTKSSSGTFLNHVRLSPANAESRPHELKDGDMLQLGVDYQGGAEDIYKCVKIRVEIGREWQAQANAFNTNALKQLKGLATDLAKTTEAKDAGKKVSTKTGLPDCCICLFAVTIQQALFIAPCSHAFHYKCLRPLLDSHYPAFVCPLCRTFADLDADVEVDADEWEEPDADALAGTSPGGRDDPMVGAETEVEADAPRLRRLASEAPDLAHLDEEDEARSVAGDADMAPPHEGVLSDEEGEAFLAAMDALDAARGASPVRAGPSAMAGVESGSSDEALPGDGTLGASKRKR